MSQGRPSLPKWSTKGSSKPNRRAYLGSIVAALLSVLPAQFAAGQPSADESCHIKGIDFAGWKAQELSNKWVRVILVPQVGGRVMQVEFGGHPYLFVNPKYKGTYTPPAQASQAAHWINYGGDKVWPLPEGTGDAEHWPGPLSDALDDGDYAFRVISEKPACIVRLEGPADSFTGLQYSREITIRPDSPEISFHAEMKNASAHSIRWSIQSVTQYDTADASDAAHYNRSFWAFAPTNPHSAYLDRYHVRSGLADDPSFSIVDGLFSLHWLYLENEVWLDSDANWIAVVDAASQFGMIERFRYVQGAEYPGKASVIFYKNGASLDLDENGLPQLRSSDPEHAPYYMEAELNSPMIRLEPGASYSFDTRWQPVRATKNLKSVTNAGIVEDPLSAQLRPDGLHVSGKFAVVSTGTLSLIALDSRGATKRFNLGAADPLHIIQLDQTVSTSSDVVRVALYLHDEKGADLGQLGKADVVVTRRPS